MAKKATTTTAKPTAAKPAATKAAAPKATASKQAAGTATIKFDKLHHGGRVRGAVNGQQFDFPVGSDVTVNAAQLEALTNSGAKFETITPLAGEGADEGSSAPSTTAEGTAIRLEAPEEPKLDEDGNPLPVPELGQKTDADFLANSQNANVEGATEAGDAEKAAAVAAKKTA